MAVTVITQAGPNRETFNIDAGEGWIEDGHGGLSIVNADKGQIAQFSNYLAVFVGKPS